MYSKLDNRPWQRKWQLFGGSNQTVNTAIHKPNWIIIWFSIIIGDWNFLSYLKVFPFNWPHTFIFRPHPPPSQFDPDQNYQVSSISLNLIHFNLIKNENAHTLGLVYIGAMQSSWQNEKKGLTFSPVLEKWQLEELMCKSRPYCGIGPIIGSTGLVQTTQKCFLSGFINVGDHFQMVLEAVTF